MVSEIVETLMNIAYEYLRKTGDHIRPMVLYRIGNNIFRTLIDFPEDCAVNDRHQRVAETIKSLFRVQEADEVVMSYEGIFDYGEERLESGIIELTGKRGLAIIHYTKDGERTWFLDLSSSGEKEWKEIQVSKGIIYRLYQKSQAHLWN